MPLFFLQSLHLLFTHVNLFKNANAFKVGIPKSKTCDLTQEEKEHTQDSPASCPKEIHLNLNFAVAKAAYGLLGGAPTAKAGDDDDDAPTVDVYFSFSQTSEAGLHALLLLPMEDYFKL